MCFLNLNKTRTCLVILSFLALFFTSFSPAYAIDATQLEKLTAGDGAAYDYFGRSVAVDGDTVVIGAYGDDDSGSAYVYRWDGEDWDEHKLTAGDGAAYDYFGISVAVDGDTVVIGADRGDALGTDSGSAYVYRWDGEDWDEHKLTAGDGAAYDYFGSSVAVDGDTVVIGAYRDNDLGTSSGSAYVFNLSPVPVFRCAGFAPPLADAPLRLRRNKVIPLRAELFNGDVEITGDDLDGIAPPIVQVTNLTGAGETPTDVVDIELPLGAADEGDQFYFIATDDGYWQLIFDARNYHNTEGTYLIEMDSGDHSAYLIDPTCTAEFVVE